MSGNPINEDSSSQKKPKQQPQTPQSRPKPKKPKKDEAPLKKQNKITNYFGTSSHSTSNEPPLDPQQQKINELKQELQAKEKQMEKMREQKEFFQNKFSLAHMENRSYKVRAKALMVQVLGDNAEIGRVARRRVDLRLGYFGKDMKFIEGDDFIQIHKSIQQKKAQLQKLQQQLKKSKNDEQKDRLKFAISFIKKQLQSRQNQLKQKQKQSKIYRDRLKIGLEELHCTYEKQHWRPILDTHQVERYLPLMMIGKGGFGEVYKCYDLEDNCHVAIKINNINLKENSPQATNFLKHVQRQVKTHKQLKHPNIAQIRQILEMTKKKFVFVMDYCTGPELSLYLKQKGWIEEQDAKKIIYQIFCALNYLSQLNTKVIHYDLKPSNIIFDHGILKILDFGLCKLMDSQDSKMELTSQGVGTYWYLPPQTFYHDSKNKQAATITPKVDVWSTGVIFYQLLYGVRPFGRGKSQQKIYTQDLITRESVNLQKIFEDNPNKCRISKQAKAFITECLQCDPEKRLSAHDAYHHPYFK